MISGMRLAVAAAVMGMVDSFAHRAPPSLAVQGWRQRAKNLTYSSSARTPKPEVMYWPMIRDGSAVLIRRRNKPPLLKRIA